MSAHNEDNMAEYFYSETLTADVSEIVWSPEVVEHERNSFQTLNRLIIRLILLGPNENPGEMNVIEVDAVTKNGEVSVPIAILDSRHRYMPLNLSFPDPPVRIRLSDGNGPVHIVGVHLTNNHLEYLPTDPPMPEPEEDDEEEQPVDEEAEEAFEENGHREPLQNRAPEPMNGAATNGIHHENGENAANNRGNGV